MSDNKEKIEHEKNMSYELGHIAQLEDIADELRERAGERFAQSDRMKEIEKARLLKKLAQEYEEEAEQRRDQWDEEYK